MKRDFDLIRMMLRDIEDLPPGSSVGGFAYDGIDEDTIVTHAVLLHEAANWNPSDQPERAYLKDAVHIKESFGAPTDGGLLAHNANLPSKLVEWLHS